MEILGIKENLQRDPLPAAVPNPGDRAAPAREGEKTGSPPPEIPKVHVQNNEEAAKALAEHMNSFMQSMRYSLQFVVDRDNNQVIIKVLDGEGNLVRQIPPEALAELSRRSGDGTGIVVNQTLE
jgi:uncharacterized FlaG/YvyC family protein